METCSLEKNKRIYDNQQPSQSNPVKVDWKAQRLTVEDGNQ